jgi:hypothetical protein
MKKLHLTISFILLSIFIYGQSDTIYFSKEKFDTTLENHSNNLKNIIKDKSLEIQDKFNQENNDLRDSLVVQNKRINNLDSLLDLQNKTLKKTLSELTVLNDNLASFENKSTTEIIALNELLNKEVISISNSLLKLDNDFSDSFKETNNKFVSVDQNISSNALYGYILIFICIVLIALFFFLTKKKVSDSNAKFNEEQMKLDKKLIELYDSKLVNLKTEVSNVSKSEKEIDHSFTLKVADEIVRMRKNLARMPEDVKGIKQLTKALIRIQDTFNLNGYEMIEMLNKPYDEGMKVVASFMPDENIETGKQIITRIIKPQVNFNGVMIQAAQIEVSVGE